MNNHIHHRGPERRQVDRRNGRVYERRKGSYLKPFLFYFLELSILFPALGIAEFTFNPLKWSAISYAIAAAWILYATRKLFRVLARQGNSAARRR